MFSYLFYHFFESFLSSFINFEQFLFNRYFCQNIHQYIHKDPNTDISVFADISNFTFDVSSHGRCYHCLQCVALVAVFFAHFSLFFYFLFFPCPRHALSPPLTTIDLYLHQRTHLQLHNTTTALTTTTFDDNSSLSP